MTYSVKEIFYTLQGEGANTGRAAVFCRFAGCNLCDTDFVGVNGEGGGKFSDAPSLASAVARAWRGATQANRLVVLTGGEPALQLNEQLIEALHAHDFEIAIETNGTLPLPHGIDWICVSPKASSKLSVTRGDELKLVYPQPLAPPERFEDLAFDHFFLQPMDGPDREKSTQWAIDYCLAHPTWRLSVQTHKVLGIP